MHATPDRRTTPRPQTIVVADDSEELLRLWSLWLSLFGFAVIQARTGAEALAAALERRPQAIVMDYAMPAMDGLTATEQLRANPATAAVPVLMVTAHPSVSLRQLAEDVGCAAFLTKPCDPEHLLEEVRRVMRSSQAS